MPIREAQPETDDHPTANPVEVGRPGGIEGGMHAATERPARPGRYS
jgi:hypothetical protein